MIRHLKSETSAGRKPATHLNAIPVETRAWPHIEQAILERVEAVELFLADVAGRFRFRTQLDGTSPVVTRVLAAREHLAAALPGFQRRIWLASADLACDSTGQFWFVDDHFSCPFGLNRLQQLVRASRGDVSQIPFDRFIQAARDSLRQFVGEDTSAVVLGSATFTTAYRDHHFFAEMLGIPFVSQRQLKMQNHGLFYDDAAPGKPVNLVIRRLQDDDLDPYCFRPESLQGVRGLVAGAKRGVVTVLNAPGTGLFNSRHLTRLIPEMIRFYLSKEPILPTVPTLTAREHTARSQTLHDMPEHIFRTDNSMDVLKPLVTDNCTADQYRQYVQKMMANPEQFVIRRTIAGVAGGHTRPEYSLRTYCVGTSDRVVLRGGIQRSCYADGTPAAPVTQDKTAVAACFAVN